MKQRTPFVLMTLCLILLAGRASMLRAQAPRTLEIGPHAGVTTTLNDINTWKVFSEVGYEFGGLVRFNYDSRWTFRLDYTHSMVRSTDTIANWRPERNRNFKAVINDASLLVEFNFLDYYTGHFDNSVSPYLFGGVSVFWYQTAPRIDSTMNANLPQTTDPDILKKFNQAWNSSLGSDRSFSIPFGFGCKFSLSKHLSTSIEWRMHYTFTDGLDGLAPLYPETTSHEYFVAMPGIDKDGNPTIDYSVVTGEPSAEALSSYDLTDQTGLFEKGQQMSNSQSMDWFGSLSLSVTWKIPLPGGSACRIINY